MSTDNAGPVMNIATDKIVQPPQEPLPYPEAHLPVQLAGLDHFGLDYPDLEAAERWHVDVLGAKIVTRRGWGGGVQPAKPHTDIRFGDSAGSVISMFIGEPSKLRDGSSVHFCFCCENSSIEALEQWQSHLLEKGVYNEIWGHFGCGAISTYFRDPWDYRFEITTNYSDWQAAEKVLQDHNYRFIGEGGEFPRI